MDYARISSLAAELKRYGVVAPYEFKIKSDDFVSLCYNLEQFYPERFVPGEVLLVKTYHGNVIVREV